jgi:hypothetical protein
MWCIAREEWHFAVFGLNIAINYCGFFGGRGETIILRLSFSENKKVKVYLPNPTDEEMR